LRNRGKMSWFNWHIISKSSNRGYDSSVKLRPLTPRDLVLKKVVGTAKKPSMGKIRA